MHEGTAQFRKSSFSAANGCVEVAVVGDDNPVVLVRDTKDRNGPALSFTAREWVAFVAGTKAGEFDLPV